LADTKCDAKGDFCTVFSLGIQFSLCYFERMKTTRNHKGSFSMCCTFYAALAAMCWLNLPVKTPGAVLYQSDFSGGSPWNWTDVVENNLSVGGTGEMSVDFGAGATNGDQGYVRHAVDGSEYSDALDITYQFDLDLSDFTSTSAHKEANIFEISLDHGNSGTEGGTLLRTFLRRANNDNNFWLRIDLTQAWGGFPGFASSYVGIWFDPSNEQKEDLHVAIRYKLDEISPNMWNIYSTLSIYALGSQIGDTVAISRQNSVGFGIDNIDHYLLGAVKSGSDLAGQMAFDNFNADETVLPEPGILAMLLIGASVITGIRKRHRNESNKLE
jgi:hypothetical protein